MAGSTRGFILKILKKRSTMKHRFLIHSLSHTILIVDISQFGIEMESNNVRTENTKMVPALRFPVWKEAEQYLLANGADSEMIEKIHTQLGKASVSVMTIV
jgi:hypothetical protein